MLQLLATGMDTKKREIIRRTQIVTILGYCYAKLLQHLFQSTPYI